MFGISTLALIFIDNLYWIGVVGEVVALPFGYTGYALAAAATFTQIFPRLKPVIPILAVVLSGVFLIGTETLGFQSPSIATLENHELFLWNENPIFKQGTAVLVSLIFYPMGLVFLRSALKNRYRWRAFLTTAGLLMAAAMFTLPTFIERETLVLLLGIRFLQVGSLAAVLVATQIDR